MTRFQPNHGRREANTRCSTVQVERNENYSVVEGLGTHIESGWYLTRPSAMTTRWRLWSNRCRPFRVQNLILLPILFLLLVVRHSRLCEHDPSLAGVQLDICRVWIYPQLVHGIWYPSCGQTKEIQHQRQYHLVDQVTVPSCEKSASTYSW
jgi:hypothetical protein